MVLVDLVNRRRLTLGDSGGSVGSGGVGGCHLGSGVT